jgi:hypothetical protein
MNKLNILSLFSVILVKSKKGKSNIKYTDPGTGLA